MIWNKYSALMLLIAVGGLVAAPHISWPTPVTRAAHAAVATCAEKETRATCYEEEVPEYLDTLSLEDVFDVIRTIRKTDPNYQYCHLLAHKLGEITVAEDPAHWMQALRRNPPDGLCSNGFIHGAVIGRFRDDILEGEKLEKAIPDFARACEPDAAWQPTSLDQAICYHGLGHLFTFITDATLENALAICERIGESPTGDFLRVCREGVFMQVFQPVEPDDFALLESLWMKPTKENYRAFCATYTKDEYEGACLREAWPLWRDELKEGAAVVSFCSEQPNQEETRSCYESVAAIIGRQSLDRPDAVARACAHYPSEYQLLCYEYGARARIEEDHAAGEQALAVCESAGTYSYQCMTRLAETAQFAFANTKVRRDFCALLPMDLQSRCLGISF